MKIFIFTKVKMKSENEKGEGEVLRTEYFGTYF